MENKQGDNKVRKVFLDELPTRGKGNQIDWKKSIGYKVNGIYNNVKFEVEIINYIKTKNKKNKIKIRYKNKEYEMQPHSFMNCQLGELLGITTSEFKIEIGAKLKDDKRDIIITNKKTIIDNSGISRKYYKYKCNKCSFDCSEHYKNGKYNEELWTEESHLINNQGCSCCCPNPQIVVEGINDIPTIAPWMISYFQGGYDEAKLYNIKSNKLIYPICPYCSRIKDDKITISNIFNSHSIGCICGDSISYPEKFMFNILEQLDIKFKFHKTFDWSKKVQVDNHNLCGNKEYDFYFKYNNEDYIIETHGLQHYKDTNIGKGKGRNYNDEIKNDRLKKELAIQNGIKEENYIVIDCRKSELDWIRDNILQSRLAELFDLSMVDLSKCEEFALSNLVKTACKFKNNNPNLTTTEIGNIMGGFSKRTISLWLKQGNIYNWCNYDAYEEHKNSIIKMKNINSYTIICLTTKDIFESSHDCERKSEKIFGTKLSSSMISKVCRGDRPHYKNYIFKYIKDLTNEEKQQYNID